MRGVLIIMGKGRISSSRSGAIVWRCCGGATPKTHHMTVKCIFSDSIVIYYLCSMHIDDMALQIVRDVRLNERLARKRNNSDHVEELTLEGILSHAS